MIKMRTFLETIFLFMAIVSGAGVATNSLREQYVDMVVLLFGVLFLSWIYILTRNGNLSQNLKNSKIKMEF